MLRRICDNENYLSMADGNAASPRFREAFRALRYYNFRLFFAGQLISLVGTWMQTVAQSWLVYRLTGSSALLGLVGFSSQIPVFLFSPLGGVAADRYNRHRLIIITQTLSMLLAFILATLTLSGSIRVWHIFILASALGIINAFDIPARQSFFQEMVGRTDLINAIALNSSMYNSARIVGPAVAGILVAWIGEGWCFFANGVSYIAVIVGLLMMRVTPRTIHQFTGSAWQHVIEGAEFVSSARPIRALLTLVAVVSFAGLQYTILMPIFADRIFHSGAHGMGILLGINGAGALSGALVLAARQGLKGLSRWVAIAALVFVGGIVAFAFASQFWIAAVFLYVVGFATMIQFGSTNTLIQMMSPDRLRGRAISAYSMMNNGMTPIGSMAAGFVAERIGVRMTIAAGGVICLIAVAAYASKLSEIRDEAKRMIRIASSPPPEQVIAEGAITS
jgi:MFS family permease